MEGADAGMNPVPGDKLRDRYGMTGILTLPPEKGGITDLLCDMDECYCPKGRWYFERILKPIPNPIPDWIPTEDHYPKSKEFGGRRDPGNVRLAHRRCNGSHYGIGPGQDRKRQKARDEKEKWQTDHPEDFAAMANEYSAAEKRWAAARKATRVPGLDEVSAHSMSFDGALVERGFWLYVWRIVAGAQTVLYVGRTGDSSSPYASSPFARVGQHLEVGPNAKGNSMGKRLRAAGIDPTSCTFRMLAIGPVFPEQADMDLHRPFRDEMAAQETALAGLLASRGFKVIGDHPAPRVYDRGLFTHVCELIDVEFPAR